MVAALDNSIKSANAPALFTQTHFVDSHTLAGGRLHDERAASIDTSYTPSECVDVLIVGTGPAGMMAAASLSRLSIPFRAIDRRAEAIPAGQADGLQPRTLEVLQQLGLAHEILERGCQMHQVSFWNPRKDGKGIERTSRARDVVTGARYQHEVTIHQGIIERLFHEDIVSRRGGVGVERETDFISYSIHEGEEYPVRVTISKKGVESVVKCKYLLGTDGARSSVRAAMGISLEGEHTDYIWGVMDGICRTTFPDIRFRCAIHSDAGSIMVIPRERTPRGVLTRLYTQMAVAPPTSGGEGVEKDSKEEAKRRRGEVTQEKVVEQAKRVLAPYEFEWESVDWYAAYQIGQRAAPRFQKDGKVFIAGDACHTHSPKAGQGMNVSMMDTFNWAWKVGLVLKGLAKEEVLETYEEERRQIARELIEFDTKFSSMFSGKIGEDSGLTHEQFLEVFAKGNGFTSGCGIQYASSILVRPDAAGVIDAEAKEAVVPGKRLFNTRLVRVVDANPRDIHDEMPVNGTFRLLILGGTFITSSTRPALDALGAYLPTPSSPLVRYSGLVEPLFVHAHKDRHEIEVVDYPETIRDWEWGLFHDDTGAAHETWGVNMKKGALVVVRPDGVVGCVAELEDVKTVEEYLGGILV
ncbi:hypothetical protein G7K_1738-t1 [Saitoella complicata NRRL Y-17804]|uniref:FAD-binding domain-containing protein n=2 Tax=Saitoella complicata (strain BCRC 22490 / CBS 7301 / JCM 7358 / NBRC 10748 / NRRL Y-17804) TaxID=698492 RepID=A0A0E9NCK6_SAICN|nr:hypothetical protein G7K_1738-t1 [Saitoella complicata NRRL Y-17804]